MYKLEKIKEVIDRLEEAGDIDGAICVHWLMDEYEHLLHNPPAPKRETDTTSFR